jgi:hypothetical protein
MRRASISLGRVFVPGGLLWWGRTPYVTIKRRLVGDFTRRKTRLV